MISVQSVKSSLVAMSLNQAFRRGRLTLDKDLCLLRDLFQPPKNFSTALIEPVDDIRYAHVRAKLSDEFLRLS